MANPDDIIDPNDLDSIDALLDEAELGVSDDLEDIEPEPVEIPDPVEAVEQAEQAIPAETELEGLDELSETIDAEQIDQLISADPELSQLKPGAQPEIEQDSVVDEIAAMAAGAAAATAINQATKPPDKPARQEPEPIDDIQQVLEQRANKKENSELTVEQMDSLKKIIIIFGATSIVLILTAIGIGVWGALAASHSGISEETQTLLETIKVNGDQNLNSAHSLETNLESIEKKLDAVNFQIEQLAGDLLNMQGGAKTAHQDLIEPISEHEKPAEHSTINHAQPAHSVVAETPKPAAVPVVTSVETVDPQVAKKIDSISYRLIKTQKAIEDVNSRIKALQQSQQEVIHSVKSVEKQQLLELTERVEAEQKAAEDKAKLEKQKSKPYSYQTPDGMFYDQRVQDSYP